MNSGVIVSSIGPVGVVGGSGIGNADLDLVLNVVTKLVAADGGADHLLAAGLTPEAVIGDLDSLSEASRAAFAECLYHIPEQETTDFEKVLTRIDAPFVVAVGFTGGRMDHTLSVLNVMARYRDRRVVLIGADDVSFLSLREKTQLHLPIGTRISLMPLDAVHVDVSGLHWPVTAANLHPTGALSTSNQVASERVIVHANGPLLITLPRQHLKTVVQAVSRAV